MGYTGFPFCLGVVSTVFFFCIFLSYKCHGAELDHLESCPSLEALRRCKFDDDCLVQGKCAEMNGSLKVCLAQSHLQGAGGFRNASLEWGRCLHDEDCGLSSQIKCCQYPLPSSGGGVCVDLLSFAAPAPTPSSTAADALRSRGRRKRCAPRTTRRPFQFFGPPSLPFQIPPPSSQFSPFPPPPFIPPGPLSRYPPPPIHPPPMFPLQPRPPPRPYYPPQPIPQPPPTPPPRPATEAVCPPTISAAFRRVECQSDAQCGTGRGAKCCPTTAGGSMCIPPIYAPISPNMHKPGNCPRNVGPWVCSHMCSSDRDCPGPTKCCPGRCQGSRLCFDAVA